MGLTNFTSGDPNDPTSTSTPPAGPPPIPNIPVPQSPAQGYHEDLAESLLINLNDRHHQDAPIQFRDALIRQTLSVLISQQKPNVLLLGPAGTGKTKIVEDIARRLASGDSLIPPQLKGYTIYELPLGSMVSGAGLVGQLEERVTAVIEMAQSTQTILFIDEIHLLQSKDPVYKKIAQLLKPAMARGQLHLIGATTTNEGRELNDDPAFQRRFERLIVDELTPEQTYEVLINSRPRLLDHYQHKLNLSDDLLRAAVAIADETAKASQHRPDNALTLIDRACASLIVDHNAAIIEAENRGDDTTAQVLRSITAITLSEKKLRSLAVRLASGQARKPAYEESGIKQALAKIKGQDTVLDEITDTLRRDALEVFPRTRPLAWLFAGPSGVGKTEVTKIVAKELTGQPPIVINMGEYASGFDESKILGAPAGYIGSNSDREKPFDTLESNPYRVILLDEMEKAHHTIQALLLSALDEGCLRAADGTLIDFSKAIIVATTNAARDQITKQPTGFRSQAHSELSQQDLVKALQTSFTPEFLGRFTRLLAFKALDRETYQEILVSCYERERVRILAQNPHQGARIPAQIDAQILAKEVSRTYLPDQGARPAEQTARRLIEDALITPAPQARSAYSAALAQAQPGPGGQLISI